MRGQLIATLPSASESQSVAAAASAAPCAALDAVEELAKALAE